MKNLKKVILITGILVAGLALNIAFSQGRDKAEKDKRQHAHTAQIKKDHRSHSKHAAKSHKSEHKHDARAIKHPKAHRKEKEKVKAKNTREKIRS